MAMPLSIYILTKNSERRLAEVLDAAIQLADEILVVDSGSTDKTEEILSHYPVRFLRRDFDNFRDQRVFAEEACTHTWVLAVDSDEVLSTGLIEEIKGLKARDFDSAVDGFRLRRDWYFLGKKVRNFYPVKTPEYVVRLFRKDKISTRGSRIIHESLRGENCVLRDIDQPLNHFTCDSIDDLYGKIGLYTRLMAEDMHSKEERTSWAKIHVFPWLLWVRWFFVYGSWRDGEAGVILSRYLRITIYLKYLKLKYL